MTKRNIFLIVQSALCVLIAAMLSHSAIRIFLEGSAYQAAGHPSEWIYSREKVVSALIPVLPVFLISVGVTIFCAVQGFKDENADKPVQDIELKRNLICARVAEPSEAMKKESSLQKKLHLGGWAGFAVCMIPVFIFIISEGHFSQADAQGLDHDILTLIAFIVPWTVAGLACLSVTNMLQAKSMQREADAASARIKEEKQAGIKAPGKSGTEIVRGYDVNAGLESKLVILRRVLLVVGIIFVIMGIRNGSMEDVLVKAIKICTECVGLG